MEICEKADVWVEKDDDFVFDYLKVILRRFDDEYFYITTSQLRLGFAKTDLDGLDTIIIPPEQIWPLADPKFTRAPDPLPSTCYLKGPSLLYYENIPDKTNDNSHIIAEVEAYEV
jgi:hypothetical protein